MISGVGTQASTSPDCDALNSTNADCTTATFIDTHVLLPLRRIHVVLACSAGDGGCAGTITASDLGPQTYVLAPGKTAAVTFDLGNKPAPSKLTVEVSPAIGKWPTSGRFGARPPSRVGEFTRWGDVAFGDRI